jgi:hypothetical protein
MDMPARFDMAVLGYLFAMDLILTGYSSMTGYLS